MLCSLLRRVLQQQSCAAVQFAASNKLFLQRAKQRKFTFFRLQESCSRKEEDTKISCFCVACFCFAWRLLFCLRLAWFFGFAVAFVLAFCSFASFSLSVQFSVFGLHCCCVAALAALRLRTSPQQDSNLQTRVSDQKQKVAAFEV